MHDSIINHTKVLGDSVTAENALISHYNNFTNHSQLQRKLGQTFSMHHFSTENRFCSVLQTLKNYHHHKGGESLSRSGLNIKLALNVLKVIFRDWFTGSEEIVWIYSQHLPVTEAKRRILLELVLKEEKICIIAQRAWRKSVAEGMTPEHTSEWTKVRTQVWKTNR